MSAPDSSAFATPQNQPIVVRARDDPVEVLNFGPITGRILEDGSRTENRLATIHFTLAPSAAGPPALWHEMHDETILVLSGTLRFRLAGGRTLDCVKGDYVVFPPRTPATFENPSGEEEAVFVNTFTPAYYVGYFRLLAKLAAEGVEMTPRVYEMAMARYATVAAQGI
ncbi:Putative rmlC-like cupin domain superfamily, rmlC-like jelly roll protein [Colletotrichum destructivum]|uniref:RmlC-like cupin domain superfamily, rmlC-like jelly roll protein n=1 Tax=Colletotrichum destructivum TaxID=34406 RepID=A0AAX4J1F4_9PEZI|nr:Putative rmlC-like cupin domain superfamily, rmlC-like jelly roll protein [Colletotrichum destructivum]